MKLYILNKLPHPLYHKDRKMSFGQTTFTRKASIQCLYNTVTPGFPLHVPEMASCFTALHPSSLLSFFAPFDMFNNVNTLCLDAANFMLVYHSVERDVLNVLNEI